MSTEEGQGEVREERAFSRVFHPGILVLSLSEARLSPRFEICRSVSVIAEHTQVPLRLFTTEPA